MCVGQESRWKMMVDVDGSSVATSAVKVNFSSVLSPPLTHTLLLPCYVSPTHYIFSTIDFLKSVFHYREVTFFRC